MTYDGGMTDHSTDSCSEQRGGRRFATTRWGLVAAAGRSPSEEPGVESDGADSRAALETLCQTYWFPLYAYVRQRVRDVDEAHDLTQAFFERLLEKNYLADATPERGRFRSFLLTSFKHFLAKEWEKARAKKRGGGRLPLALDFRDSDSRLASEPADSLTPEQIYEREWVLTLLQRVMSQLRTEYVEAGKLDLFDRLKDFIIGQYSESGYAAVAEALGSTEPAMKMTAHRMRRRYRELLRSEIAETVTTADEVDDEIHSLFSLFQS